MKHTAVALTILSGLLASLAQSGQHDFYARTRYPEGGGLVPGADLYTPVQSGTGNAKAYERRTVGWWPRKGVDIIEPTDGMPLRNWTWRTPPPGEPAAFKAHLVAFRGMGNTMSSKFRGGDGGPIEPAVVLRLADGRKRCFLRGSFCDDDKAFIMALYVQEMNRIKAGLDKTPRVKRPSADVKFPNNAKPGEPGTMQVESERFIWLSGSQAGSDGDPWVSEKEPDKAAWFRKGSIECAESWWAMNEYAGHLMPYWDRKQQLKYEITVPGTKRDGYQVIPGYAGGGYGACGIKGAGGGPWSLGLFHEWGHGALSNGWRVGGGEAQADMHQTFASPILKGNHHVTTPWRNIFNGGMGYGYTVFYNFIGDDPNWGYGWFACVPSGAGEQSIMQIAARVGQQRGMFKNGIRGFGDLMGEYGARLATFDCELAEMYRKAYFAPARSWLEPVDPAKGIYRIPIEEAPEPYGVNIVRLAPDEDAAEIVVDFTGLHDADFYSDWRAAIVAVGADGTTRYSPLWNKGRMAFKRRAGDLSTWLTVAATPTAIYSESASRRNLAQAVYSGRYAYRHPWSVQLAGARPGTPRECRADLGDVALRYRLNDAVPAPRDTPAGKAYLAKLKAFVEQLGDDDEAANLKSQALAEIQRMTEGRRHPNGGGWVANTATVAPTAYVGPDAMVLGQAKVLDHAIVEDYAVVTDRAVVSGHARISGQAIVTDSARAEGYARTWHTLDGDQAATVVPRRLGAKALHKTGLWANYAMDRDEKTVLLDWYRFPHGADRRYGKRLGVNLSGYLVGRPTFVVDGQRRGFRFDGTTQYAELSPRLADLGEMTVDIALKWAGSGSQTILDLGTSPDHCLVLRTDRGGRPEAVATVGGKAVASVACGEALPTGSWTRLRLECDGKALALCVDGKRVASHPTRFRPCDAFPPGAAKRSFLAAARDGSSHFKGTIDGVVVYHTVADDLSDTPAPIRDAPTRPTREFIAAMEKAYGNIAVVNEKIKAGVDERYAPFEKLRLQKDARNRELLERSPAFLEAEANLEAVKKAMDSRKASLAAEFAKTPDAARMQASVDAMKKHLSQLSATVHTLEKERFDADPQLEQLTAQRKAADTRRRDLEKTLRQECETLPATIALRKTLAELREQIDALKPAVQKLGKQARDADAELAALYARRKANDKDRDVRRQIREREDSLKAQLRKANPDVRKYDGLSSKYWHIHNNQLRKTLDAFCRKDPAYGRLVGEVRKADTAIRDRQKELRDALRKESAPVREQQALTAKLRDVERTLRGRRDQFIATSTTDMTKKLGQAEAALAKAREDAMAPYWPEKLWMGGFQYQAYRGYYNTPYRSYLGSYVKARVGGGEMRENLDLLAALEKSLADGTGWHTTVDWEWRLKEELDGRIKELPLMRKWLVRVRGK